MVGCTPPAQNKQQNVTPKAGPKVDLVGDAANEGQANVVVTFLTMFSNTLG
jgi:hypothetical protein